MNTKRRKAIAKAIEDYLSKETEAREALREALESARNEEEESYENLPESIQYGEKGEAMEESISLLDDFISELDDDPYYDAIDTLKDSLGIEV